jgi:hypothetical protein
MLILSSAKRPTTAMSSPPICYLCGKPLCDPVAVDHVPPRQLFAPELRKKHNLNRLLTIQTHRGCNTAYEKDEHYFLHSLAAFGAKTYSGRPVLQKVAKEFREGHHRPLVETILKEFATRPSGLVLPGNKVAKRFQGDRMHRVAWKIVRGLVFYHFGETYPDDWTVGVTITAPSETPPDHYLKIGRLGTGDDLGPYPGIFAYRYVKSDIGQYWALLLWDAVIITVRFHDHACQCDECTSDESSATTVEVVTDAAEAVSNCQLTD